MKPQRWLENTYTNIFVCTMPVSLTVKGLLQTSNHDLLCVCLSLSICNYHLTGGVITDVCDVLNASALSWLLRCCKSIHLVPNRYRQQLHQSNKWMLHWLTDCFETNASCCGRAERVCKLNWQRSTSKSSKLNVIVNKNTATAISDFAGARILFHTHTHKHTHWLKPFVQLHARHLYEHSL